MDSQRYNARLGIVLFVIYSLVYLAFALLNAFAPQLAQSRQFAGLNLAINAGMGLIALALALALVYGFLCKPESRSTTTSSPAGDKNR